MTSTKRPRNTSFSDSSDISLPSRSRSSSPATKYARFPSTPSESSSSFSPLTCTLSPTCSFPNRPTRLNSQQEVESHYTTYHAHVCENPKCQCVFPDARFLELHILECHDPITALRKERGEKTFACLVGPPTCTRVFSTPKGRRLHLINFHNYPKQYFFGIVNKGIGGLLKKWGPAASLYRGEWKPRKELSQGEVVSDAENEMDVAECLEVNSQIPPTESGVSLPVTLQIDSRDTVPPISPIKEKISSTSDSEIMADINDASLRMASLSLVPDKVRFGRGGKRGGFVRSR